MPTHKADLKFLNVTQLAALVGCKPHTMRRRLDGLEPARTDGRSRLYNSAAALGLYFTGESLDLSRERARLAREQAEATALRNAQTRGELLPRDACVRQWSAQLMTFKHSLRALPGRAVIEIPGFTRPMARQLLGMIDAALEDLAAGRESLPRHGKRR